MKKALMLSALFVVAAAPVYAKPAHHHAQHHSKHADKKGGKHECSPSTRAYEASMQNMHKGMMVPYLGDADTDFVRGMIPHHQGAVDMAKIELQYGKDEKMRKLARWIISTQEQEIAQMKYWLQVRGVKEVRNPNAPSSKEFEAEMEVMHRDMSIKYTGNADVDFARGMVPHHQGAVDMALTLRKYGRDPMLQKLAEDIIRSQRQEINLMNNWLNTNG